MNIHMKLLIMLAFIISTFKLNAMTIKLRGSGGIVSTNDKPKICPNSSNEICATITGPWWELVGHWWNSLGSIKTTDLHNAELDVVNSTESIEKTKYNLRIENGTILKFDSKKQQVEISGTVHILKR